MDRLERLLKNGATLKKSYGLVEGVKFIGLQWSKGGKDFLVFNSITNELKRFDNLAEALDEFEKLTKGNI